MVNRELQITNINSELSLEIQQHNLLTASEHIVGLKILSKFDNSNLLIITNERLLIVKDWQTQSINLSDITNVHIATTTLGFDIVQLQTKNYAFDMQIEHKNLDNLIQLLQADPKIVTYAHNTNKPESFNFLVPNLTATPRFFM